MKRGLLGFWRTRPNRALLGFTVLTAVLTVTRDLDIEFLVGTLAGVAVIEFELRKAQGRAISEERSAP